MAQDAEGCRDRLLKQYPGVTIHVESGRAEARAMVETLQAQGVMALLVEYGGCNGFEHGN